MAVSLDELVKAATVYPEWAVPLDPQLRRGAQIGTLASGAAIPIALFCVPALLALTYSGWAGALLGWAVTGLLAVLQSPVGLAFNGLALASYGWLWFATDGLQAGRLVWHKLALALAGLGAVNLLAISLPLVLAVVNVVLAVVIGIAMAALVLLALFVVLGVGLGGSR